MKRTNAMVNRKTKYSYLELPNRQWIQKLTIVLLVTVGVAMFIMSNAGHPAASRLRSSINDMVVPVLAVAARPFEAVQSAALWVKEMALLRSENIRLKQQNAELLQWQAAAKEMQQENHTLRQLLRVVPSKELSYVTVRMVSDIRGPYIHSALINGGAEAGIKQDQAVVTHEGLIGRTLDVGERSSRVLLLSDINSRVPVLSETSREKSILAGNNNAQPTLIYLPTNSKISVGERIVTSGDGGIFPAGIAVGVVTSVENGEVRIQPYVDPAKTSIVSAVNFSF